MKSLRAYTVFEATDGTFIKTLGVGHEQGQLRHPVGLALDARGNLFVADSSTVRRLEHSTVVRQPS